MNQSKIRRQIAWEAARLMFDRDESEYYRAKLKAARKVCKGWVKPADLPSNAEIRDEILNLSRLFDGKQQEQTLKRMRIEALRMMRLLNRFRPRIIGSVLTGHVRRGSDIDLHVFCDNVESVAAELEFHGMIFDVERKKIRKGGEMHVYRHIHVQEEFPVELTVYAANAAHHVFKSSITGKPIERASIPEFEAFLKQTYEGIDLESEVNESSNRTDRFQLYESLLLPLENVKQNPQYHPEGDALYHSLQVFDLACDELPYDEEFLLAALLHDVGKAIDPYNHVDSGLEALEGFITDRTSWLIEHHMEAHKIHDNTIGRRAHRRLRENESYDELVLLSKCDKQGRKSGIETSELEEAIEYLRNLAGMFG